MVAIAALPDGGSLLPKTNSAVTNSAVSRLLPRLAYQLVPAVIVTIVGVLLLGSLAKTPNIKTPDVAPDARPVETAIDGEAIFKMTPRAPAAVQADDQDAKSTDAKSADAKPAKAAAPRTAAKPKPAAVAATQPPRPAANAPASPPLMLTPAPPQAATAEAAPAGDTTVMGTLRSATAAVQQMPQRAARSVAGWFSESPPPRPPAPVPTPNFQTAM